MTGYVYRGRKPEGLPGLEEANAAIMADRAAAETGGAPNRYTPRLRSEAAVTGRKGGLATARRKDAA